MGRTIHCAVTLTLALSLAGCCGGGCPTSSSPESLSAWAAELSTRGALPLAPKGKIAIKRDVRNVWVDVDARSFAHAFHDVMRDPASQFGLIRVDRLPQNVGKSFTLGEKFQGRYSLEGAVAKDLPPRLRQAFGELADHEGVNELLCRIENGHTSDYGEIVRLELEPPAGRPHVLQYRYLKGSPIAGSSTFVVTDVDDPAELSRLGVTKASRLEQIFEYQEQTADFALFFSQAGLKLHNQVVFSQAEQSAKRAGGKILDTDIPPEYRNP